MSGNQTPPRSCSSVLVHSPRCEDYQTQVDGLVEALDDYQSEFREDMSWAGLVGVALDTLLAERKEEPARDDLVAQAAAVIRHWFGSVDWPFDNSDELAAQALAAAGLLSTGAMREVLDSDELPRERVEELARWLYDHNVGICELDDNIVYNELKSMRALAEELLRRGPDGIRITQAAELADSQRLGDRND